MATEVSPAREVIFQEDTAYRRSGSEVIFTKFAAQNNFINKFQTDCHRFNVNASFRSSVGIGFFDGVTTFFYNTEIVAINFWQVSSTNGITRYNLHWLDTSGNDQGSIFSTRPTINSTTQKVGFRNLETGLDVNPPGITLPTFSKTTFNQGESIFLIVDDAASNAFNGGLSIYYRPIN